MIFKDLILCSHLILPPGLQQLHHLRFAVVEAWQGSFFFDLVVHFFQKDVINVPFWIKSRSLTFLKYSFRFFFSDSSSAAAC